MDEGQSVDRPRSRVLLVDDDPDILRDYSRILERMGCALDTAENGRDAIEKLEGQTFDLIISDVRMPGLSGTDFLRAVREQDLDVPVILVTGAPEIESAVKAVEYGAFRYLIKPVTVETITNAVKRAVHMHELARLKREAMEIVGAEGRHLGDRASLEGSFESALEKLWMAYQPIVDWPRTTVFAYEALLRSDEPSLGAPPDLLDAAERLGRLPDLGRRIRACVTSNAANAPDDVLLFVNLHPSDLNDPELLSPNAPLSAIASRVVLEVTERTSLHGVKDLSATVAKLRDLGFRLAVDDLGAGYAGLASFSQLEPEFVKLDMSLVRGVDRSVRKQTVVRAMARLCEEDLAIKVISEGVETPRERDALADQGCALLQGYLFAKPAREFAAPRW